MQGIKFLTYLQGVFHSSHPIELLSTLELVRAPIGQAGIQPAHRCEERNGRDGKAEKGDQFSRYVI